MKNDPEKAKYLEENLAALPDCRGAGVALNERGAAILKIMEDIWK